MIKPVGSFIVKWAMKTIYRYILLALFFSAFTTNGQRDLRKIENDAFTTSEILEFKVSYGFVNAGVAKLEVKENMRQFGDRNVYHIVGTGRSVGAFDWFFKVRDRYETFLDVDALLPWYFKRDIQEGGYSKKENLTFNHFDNVVKSDDGLFDVPVGVQDLISAFYYARTLDFDSAQVGDRFEISAFLDDELIPLNIKYLGKEKLKTKLGTFNCIKFAPMLQEGRVFKDNEDMTIWVTDDKNLIPVRAQANILVGSIKMDLTGYKNLLHPLAAKVK